MRAAVLSLSKRLAAARLFARYGYSRPALVVAPHLIAFAIMIATEATVTAMTAFVLAWGILNFFWLALTRRPLVAGALSLTMMTVLVLLSQLKYHVLMMTANFVDLMIVDTDTVSFLFTIFPATALDRGAMSRCARCAAGAGLAARSVPRPPAAGARLRARLHRLAHHPGNAISAACRSMAFYGGNHVSSFARSGVDAVSELLTQWPHAIGRLRRRSPATGRG